ncbi:MAG: hypothetical protein D6677_02795 [Calditrichaeota bacterium]|nr:MAG: hypothetical protein D6677_02795 [Calditrichota bacterium]
MNLFGPKIDKPHTVVQNCIIPHALYYDTDKHLWLRPEKDGAWTVGLTDMAQTLGGKVLHYKPWKEGFKRKAHKPVVMLEAAKWLGVISVPFPVTVGPANPDLMDDAYMINQFPYTKGWLIKIYPEPGTDVAAFYVSGEEAGRLYREHFEDWQMTECVHCLGFEV